MEHMGNLAMETSQFATAQTPLICGLPDDVALLCLAKIPRTYHANLKCVSKRWRELVCGEELDTFRKKHNLSETWIYALCEDEFDCERLCCYVLDPCALKKRWKRLQDLPPRVARRLGTRFEVLGKKAYLIGGHYISKLDLDEEDRGGTKMKAIDEVYCYDATTNSWNKGVPLTTPSSNMEHMENLATESSQHAIAQTPLIHGLPDDVALLCLAKVPRTYHANLKCVSKRWRELVCGEELDTFRKKHNLSETWIYALCEDEFDCERLCCYVLDPYALKKRWKRLQDLPPRVARRLGTRFEVLGKKAYLIGGHYISKLDLDEEDRGGTKMKAIDEVYCYDATMNSWNKSVPLTTPRCYFASEVLNGKIYAFGSTSDSDSRQTWETYDPITNTWTSHSYPDVISSSTGSTVFNEKIYVRNSSSGEPSHACGAIYEPPTDTWHEADTGLISGWRDPVVVVDGKLFSFDHRPGFKLRMWREDRKKWMVVAELSSYLWESPYRVVGIGKSIFFIGKGLATTKLDVSNVGKGGVLLISDVTEGFGEGRPISCKCMTI